MAAGCGIKTLVPSVENIILLYDSFAYVLGEVINQIKIIFSTPALGHCTQPIYLIRNYKYLYDLLNDRFISKTFGFVKS